MKRRGKEILKGIAGVGMALGGAQAFAEHELIFASELEQSEELIEVYEEESASTYQSEMTVEEASVSVQESISLENSLLESESVSANDVSESISASLSESTEAVDEELASAYEEISTAESIYKSTGVGCHCLLRYKGGRGSQFSLVRGGYSFLGQILLCPMTVQTFQDDLKI